MRDEITQIELMRETVKRLDGCIEQLRGEISMFNASVNICPVPLLPPSDGENFQLQPRPSFFRVC